jgi:4-amino-4-deoxychorismate lyase
MSVALFESLKIENGIIYNLPLHIARMNKGLKTFYPNQQKFTTLPISIPEEFLQCLVKCRIDYAPEISNIIFTKYEPKIPLTYNYVYDDNITYSHKYADRNEIETHQNASSEYDEIVMVKHNMLTDASYSNICLFNGTEWHTPKYPLLKGVKRQQLINEKKITEKVILLEDLHLYKRISFINAMNDLGVRELDVREY